MNRRALLGGALALLIVALTRGVASAEDDVLGMPYSQYREYWDRGWIVVSYNVDRANAVHDAAFLEPPNGIWVKTRPGMKGIMWVRSAMLPIDYYKWEPVNMPGENMFGPSWQDGVRPSPLQLRLLG